MPWCVAVFQWSQPLSRSLHNCPSVFLKPLTHSPTWPLCLGLLSSPALSTLPVSAGMAPRQGGLLSSPALDSSLVGSLCSCSRGFYQAASSDSSLLVCLPQSSPLSFQSDSTNCLLDKNTLTSHWGLRFWRAKLLTLDLQAQNSSTSIFSPTSLCGSTTFHGQPPTPSPL